jgi:hypothetical protein
MACGVGTITGVLGVSIALACSSSNHDSASDGQVHPSTGGAEQGGTPSSGGAPPSPPTGGTAAISGGMPGSGGSSAQGGSTNVAGNAGAGAAGGSAGAASECLQTRSADPAATLLHVPIELVAGGKPFELGGSYPLDAGEYSVSALAFFLSNATLLLGDGSRVPARFADPGGAPRPYDLHLVTAADPTSLSVDLLAPPGDYKALELGVGVPQGCNRGDPTRAVYPLNASTGMYWTWATGYMFIRVEGSTLQSSAVRSFAYHVGLDIAYRSVALNTPFSMPTATPPRLVLDVTRVMASADDPGGGMHTTSDLAVAERFAAEGTLVLSP